MPKKPFTDTRLDLEGRRIDLILSGNLQEKTDEKVDEVLSTLREIQERVLRKSYDFIAIVIGEVQIEAAKPMVMVNLALTVVRFAMEHGLDLDWYYPENSDAGLVIEKLHEKLHSSVARTSRSDRILDSE